MRTSFPLEFQKILVLKQTNYTHLAKALERRGYRLSKQFLCQMGNGSRRVPSIQLNRVCDTLGCSADERRVLSLAACRDDGFLI